MPYKLTVDGGLLRDSDLLPAVRTLKAWEAEGKVEIFESDRVKESVAPYTWPGASRPTVTMPRSRPVKRSSGGPSFQSISVVLFPNRDPHRLNMTEVNEVAHLMRHHASGNSIFVTTNSRVFIDEGKRTRLHSSFKIVILTPDEAVRSLESSQAWSKAAEPENIATPYKRGA